MTEKMMELTAADGFTFSALHVEAEGARMGGLVLIQEIFGINSYMVAAARRFAAAGFEVIVPSMFDRQEKGFVREGHDAEAIGAGGGHARANGLDNAMRDISACLDALEGPVYVSGYCYGGSMAYLAACEFSRLTAASCYYGSLVPGLKDRAPLCPTIVHFGRKDGFIPMDGVEAFAAARPDVPTYIYEAGHGFARPESHDYDAASDALAWKRTTDLFEAAFFQ
jgi:carboxymethylenebutenolidase